MNKVGLKMSLMMGGAMSLCLSLAGTLSSGQFSFPGFLRSFAISFVISLCIGFLVPMGKVLPAVNRRFKLMPGKLSTRCADALVSDLLYTPLISFVMITINYRIAVSHGAPLKYGPMLIRGILMGVALGFVLAFLLMPVFMRIAKGKNEGR